MPMDWTMGNISLKVAVNLSGFIMLACAIALCYAIPLHLDEALLGRDRGVLVDAPVTWVDPEKGVVSYQYEVAGQAYSGHWRAPASVIEKIAIGDSVKVRYCQARPSYNRPLAELDGHRPPAELFTIGVLVVFVVCLLVQYFGTTWEHLAPVLQARREGRKPPRDQVLKIRHNLGGLIAVSSGAVAIGMVILSGMSGSHSALQTPGMVLAVAAWLGFMALRKWSPF
jgi:hypothetical protein